MKQGSPKNLYVSKINPNDLNLYNYKALTSRYPNVEPMLNPIIPFL